MKRVKRRYIAFYLESEAMPSERELLDAIWASVTKLFGEVGASLTGLALINVDLERKVAVIRCSLVSLVSVRASLSAITSVAGKNSSLHVLVISGTLKALYANIVSSE
jgi:RNase P/RNase MRP subunit POP5